MTPRRAALLVALTTLGMTSAVLAAPAIPAPVHGKSAQTGRRDREARLRHVRARIVATRGHLAVLEARVAGATSPAERELAAWERDRARGELIRLLMEERALRRRAREERRHP